MTEQLYDQAFQQMGVAPLEQDENPGPTPARKKAWERASQKTRNKLAKAAQLAGFESIGKLADAINNGTHKVVRMEEEWTNNQWIEP